MHVIGQPQPLKRCTSLAVRMFHSCMVPCSLASKIYTRIEHQQRKHARARDTSERASEQAAELVVPCSSTCADARWPRS